MTDKQYWTDSWFFLQDLQKRGFHSLSQSCMSHSPVLIHGIERLVRLQLPELPALGPCASEQR